MVLCVRKDCKLCDVLEEVGYDDRADYVIKMRTSTTTTADKQDAELKDKIKLHVESGNHKNG